MANFETHFKASVVTSAAVSSVVLATGLANGLDATTLFVIGSLAGLLPDLDADKSRSLNSLFSILALCIAISLPLLVSFGSIIGLWCGGLLTYLVIMYILKPLFESYTIHRGANHSLLAVIMITLSSIHLALLAGKPLNIALLIALSTAVGMLTHLILDECYSVDINNNELKASFGSALKPIALSAPLASLMQLLVIGAAIYLLQPHYEEVISILLSWQHKLAALPLLPNLNSLQHWF